MEAPILTDIRITYDGFDVFDIEPVVPSTLYAQKPIVIFGKWQGNPLGTIHITGKTGTDDYAIDIPVSSANLDDSNTALPYLWARRRIDRLTDFGTYKNNPEAKKEITELGPDYNMATNYTSFIAVLETVRNPNMESTDVNQPTPLPLHVSNLAIGSGYTIGSEPDSILLISGTIFIIIAGIYTQNKRNEEIIFHDTYRHKKNYERKYHTKLWFLFGRAFLYRFSEAFLQKCRCRCTYMDSDSYLLFC